MRAPSQHDGEIWLAAFLHAQALKDVAQAEGALSARFEELQVSSSVHRALAHVRPHNLRKRYEDEKPDDS